MSPGRAGEGAAARLLESEGWTLLARNFRAGRGEIDIIAEKGDTLAFVEVKTWSRLGPEELERSVGPDKRRRIIETSQIFLSRHRQYSDARLRYDLLLMKGDSPARRIEGAFTGEL